MSRSSAAAELVRLFTEFEVEARKIIAGAADAPACGRTLGQLIAQERADAKLTLEEVAQRAGTTKSHLWELEKERVVNPTVAMCAGIARALGMSFEVVCHAALASIERKP